MAIRTLPGSSAPPPAPHAAAPQQAAQQTPPQPTQSGRERRPPAPPSSAGLPPPPTDVDTSGGGGGFEKRDDAYWESHPWRPGTYDLHLYVNKIVDWGQNGHTVALKCIDWDASVNRPGPHHGRPLAWDQNMRAEKIALMNRGDGSDASEKAKRAFAYFRRDLVANYVSLGLPEDKWDKDAAGNVVPPWYDFFTWVAPDGVVVPVVLRAKITVRPQFIKFPNISDMKVVRSADGSPVQAPMPFEVVPYVAEIHGWQTTESRTITVNGRTTADGFRYDAFTTEVVRVARDAIPFPHLGLSTYKDLA